MINIIKNILELNKKFKEIKNKGWIQSTINGNSSIGRTFETQIGNNENSLEIPDYKGIEIKTKISKKNIFITLFNCKPEGLYYKETERLKNAYGYYNFKSKEYKVLNNSIYCKKETIIGENYKFKLNVDRKNEKIYLYIYDINNLLIENNTYWDFDVLKEKLYRKMKYLAYVKGIKKYTKDGIYFKYKKINFYKLKNFEEFIKMIEQDKIRITLKIGVYKRGKKKGKTYDHGTGFDICEKNILDLYDEIIL